MPGERSKSSGEYGEKIAAGLLDLIGWNSRRNGVDINCIMPNAHVGANGNPRQTHGVDYIVQYNDPLASLQTTNLLISVKHRESYPATPAQRVSKFKEFLKDIAEAAECFPSAANEFPPISGTTSIRNICVILWINEAAGALNTSIVPDIATFRNTDKVAFDTVYLVDNRQAAFLHDSIKYAQNSDASFCFYYPDTGSNMNTVQRIHQGKILPVEYVTSPILLFKLSSTEGNKLLLTTSQQYSKERLSRILQLARLITENWASGITIAFRDYRDYDSKAEVEACLNELHDPAFKRQVQVVNLPADDFRNMGGNNNA